MVGILQVLKGFSQAGQISFSKSQNTTLSLSAKVLALHHMGGLSSALSRGLSQAFWLVPGASSLYSSPEPLGRVKRTCLAPSHHLVISICLYNFALSLETKLKKNKGEKPSYMILAFSLLFHFSVCIHFNFLKGWLSLCFSTCTTRVLSLNAFDVVPSHAFIKTTPSNVIKYSQTLNLTASL